MRIWPHPKSPGRVYLNGADVTSLAAWHDVEAGEVALYPHDADGCIVERVRPFERQRPMGIQSIPTVSRPTLSRCEDGLLVCTGKIDLE